ncbi:hypothetical protein [Aquibaculum sediminis]|uniref:hypothetical protein n=1 Tax=Aquibaculum sediminis TaxID=3231907 RepID=UPI0034523648
MPEMKFKYEKSVVDSFHDQVTVKYCGIQVSKIIEKGIRKLLLDGHLNGPSGKIDDLQRKVAECFSSALWLTRRRNSAPPWSPGDTLFVCHNETGFSGVSPLVKEMSAQKRACAVILPEEGRNWSSLPPRHEGETWVFGASFSEAPRSAEIKAIVRAFKKQTSAFLLQHHLQNKVPIRSDLVAQAKHALTRIELIRSWIKRAEPGRIVVNQPKEEPLYYSLAGRVEGVPTVIVPHGVLRGRDVFRPAFYDLGLFDVGVVRSYRCAVIAHSLNPSMRTIVTGFSGFGSTLASGRDPGSEGALDQPGQVLREGIFRVGMAADKDLQDVNEVAAAAARAGVMLFVKGRPPGRDGPLLQEAIGAHRGFKALPHEAISLDEFLNSVAGIVCTRSNVAFHAAAQGVPVIYWRGVKARQTSAGPRNADSSDTPEGLAVEDVALESPRDVEELVETLSKWRADGAEALERRRQKQIQCYARWFPQYDPEVILRSMLS